MRCFVFAALFLLGLPQAAFAAALDAWGEPVFADNTPAIGAALSVAPALGLDPIDGVQPPVPPRPAHDAERADRGVVADREPADRGLSFGFEIRPRTPFGALARKDDAEERDQLDKLIERPVFGLRGRYRF